MFIRRTDNSPVQKEFGINDYESGNSYTGYTGDHLHKNVQPGRASINSPAMANAKPVSSMVKPKPLRELKPRPKPGTLKSYGISKGTLLDQKRIEKLRSLPLDKRLNAAKATYEKAMKEYKSNNLNKLSELDKRLADEYHSYLKETNPSLLNKNLNSLRKAGQPRPIQTRPNGSLGRKIFNPAKRIFRR